MTNSIDSFQLKQNEINLYVANWDGASSDVRGLSSIGNARLTSAVQNQLGTEARGLYDSNFINYNSGYILCVNTPTLLNKFFADSNAADASVSNSVRFTSVLMPNHFIGKINQLSKNYVYGEKLRIFVGFELQGDSIRQAPYGSAFKAKITPSSGQQILVYRDENVAGRCLKSQGSGGGIGVWS